MKGENYYKENVRIISSYKNILYIFTNNLLNECANIYTIDLLMNIKKHQLIMWSYA